MKTTNHHPRRTTAACLLLSACSLGFSPSLFADLAILKPGEGDFNWNPGSQNTYGWIFTVGANDLLATRLGIWDADYNGLAAAHPVGLWNSSGTLLGSVVVKAGVLSPLVGEFRLEQMSSSLTLAAGATYTIGALYSGDDYLHASNANPPLFSPNISGLVARYEYGSSLTYPTRVFGTTPYVGPTFEFTVVPEPASASMLLGAAVIWLAGGFRKFEAR